MSTAPYIPRTDSLADKVCRYFMRLPAEELLSREIAANYGTTPSNVGHQLTSAVEAGYLQVDGSVYCAGKKLHLLAKAHEQLRESGAVVTGDAAKTVHGVAQPPLRKPRTVNKPFKFDLSSVKVEPGVPMPPNHRTGLDWTALLNRLAVGDSFALPADGRASVSKAITTYKRLMPGKEMSVRKVEDGLRVWRVK